MNQKNTSYNSHDIANCLVSLMPQGGDDGMWRESYARLFEAASGADDLFLLRAGKRADEIEPSIQAFAASFPGVELTRPPEGGYYRWAVQFARLDRDVRGAMLKAWASQLRGGVEDI